MADRSAWEAQFGSGLKEAYDFTIFAASFTTDMRYNNGQNYVLLLTGVDEDGEPTEEMLAVGTDWESLDGGFTLTHPRKTGTINKNSTYGKWCENAADACDKVNNEYIFDKDPKVADIWVNTKWRLAEKKIGEGFTRKGTNEVVAPRFRLVPDEFLGLVDDDGAVIDSRAPQAAPAPPKPSAADLVAKARADAPQTTSAVATPATNGSSPIVSKLTTLASTNDYETFIGLALADDDVLTDDGLVESLIDSGPNGFYAQHRS